MHQRACYAANGNHKARWLFLKTCGAESSGSGWREGREKGTEQGRSFDLEGLNRFGNSDHSRSGNPACAHHASGRELPTYVHTAVVYMKHTRQLFSPVLSLSISHGCVPTFFLTLFLEHEKNAQLTRYRQRHTWTKQTTRTASWKAGREGRVETAETESSRG